MDTNQNNDFGNGAFATGDVFTGTDATMLPEINNISDIRGVLHSLHNRLSALENRGVGNATVATAGDGVSFTAGDRAVLDEVASFLGVHRVVANAVETRRIDPQADIDPNTGLPREAVRQMEAPRNNGAFVSRPIQQGDGL